MYQKGVPWLSFQAAKELLIVTFITKIINL